MRLIASLFAITALCFSASSAAGSPSDPARPWKLTTLKRVSVYPVDKPQVTLDISACLTRSLLPVLHVLVEGGNATGPKPYLDLARPGCQKASGTFKKGDAIYLHLIGELGKYKSRIGKLVFASGTITITPQVPTGGDPIEKKKIDPCEHLSARGLPCGKQ